MFHRLIPRFMRHHKKEAGLRPLAELRQLDSHFDEGDLQARLSNLTLQMLQCRCTGSMEPLQPYVTPALYEELTRKARQYPEKGQRLHIVRPCVLRCEALGYRTVGDEHRVLFRVQTRMGRYVTDKDRQIVAGSRRKELFEVKTWELSRPAAARTEPSPDVDTTSCPACGSPVNPYESAICPRCGTAVPVERYAWTICAID